MTFLIISVIVANLTVILIPKRLTKIEILATCLFALVFELTVDSILNIKYDLYRYFTKGIVFESYIAVFGLYPALNIIILNYFPKSLKSKLLYILAWSVGLTSYEWASVKSGYFIHITWKYSYSFVCYLLIVTILYWCLLFVRKIISKQYSPPMNKERL